MGIWLPKNEEFTNTFRGFDQPKLTICCNQQNCSALISTIYIDPPNTSKLSQKWWHETHILLVVGGSRYQFSWRNPIICPFGKNRFGPGAGIPSIIIETCSRGFEETPLFSSTNHWEAADFFTPKIRPNPAAESTCSQTGKVSASCRISVPSKIWWAKGISPQNVNML